MLNTTSPITLSPSGSLPQGGGKNIPSLKRSAGALEYAPHPPSRRRRIVRRASVFFALIVVVGIAIRWLPAARDRIQIQFWQRQCLNHRPAPGKVVYDDEGERTRKLLADPRYQVRYPGAQDAYFVPRHWSELYARLSPPGLNSNGTVFLGRMTTPAGQTRLVALDVTYLPGPGTSWAGIVPAEIPSWFLTARVIQPGSVLNRPKLLSSSTESLSRMDIPSPVLTANLDPEDSSHVALLGDRVDAWLRDDDTVLIAPRVKRQFMPFSMSGYPTPPAPTSPALLRSSAGPATRPSGGPVAR